MRRIASAVVVAVFVSATLAAAQGGRKPAPATRKPVPPATKPVPAKPQPPPPPSDVRFRSKYTSGGQVTESVTYVRGVRERYELGDMILLRQHDLKRSVQISTAANTYLVVPDADNTPAATGSGVVVVESSVAEVGERKPMFDQPARRVVTVLDRQPQAGACDQTKQRIETDGWYIDVPKAVAAQPPASPAASPAACRDEIKMNQTGDANLLGFPLSYSTTAPGADGKPTVVAQMEVIEFEITNLDASLFDIPSGMTEVTSGRDLVKAVSDANEAKLAAAPSSSSAAPRTPGVVRVAVPELTNKTSQQVDTRALRTQLISELTEQKMEAAPLAAADPSELNAHAKELGCDYLLLAQITELKASKPGRIGRLVKRTAGESTEKDVTEAKLSVQLVPVGGGKPRLTTTTEGNDGGIGFKTGLRLARAAAMLYLRYASPIAALNTMQMMNMGGMGGFLTNPALMQMQGAGLMGTGRGLDRTAGAAMFMMDAMTAGASGESAGPSFDASLAEALEAAARKSRESLPR